MSPPRDKASTDSNESKPQEPRRCLRAAEPGARQVTSRVHSSGSARQRLLVGLMKVQKRNTKGGVLYQGCCKVP